MSLPNSVVRVATATVGIPLVVGAVYLGGWPFLVLVLCGALIAQHELYTLLGQLGVRAATLAGLVIGAAAGLRTEFELAIPLAIALSLVSILFILLSRRFESPWQSLAATLTGVFYPTVLFTYLVDLREGAASSLAGNGAFWLTMSVLGLVWVSDTAAYYVGRSFGKRRLAPEISPGKTWEGSIGGAVASVAAALLLWNLDLAPMAWYHFVVLGLICGTVGQLGDLAESRLKRLAGVKDSGTIIPGHGGLLDRLDAMIIAVPLAYLYLTEVARIL